ncbi:MAG: SPOR domain-containing protein [Desulfomonilaceae bacterium]
MELRKRLIRILKPAEKKPRRPIPGGDNQPPKNGPLGLAVAASVIVMIVLGILDVRLIRDRSNKGVSVGPAIPTQPYPASSEVPLLSNKSAIDVPPEVTFYRQLTMQDDQSPGNGKGRSDPNQQTGSISTEPSANAAEISKEPGKPGEQDQKQPKTGLGKPTCAPTQQNRLPKAGSGGKTYTVQVGAFTQPAIAQQWALKWKVRGYDVTLRPVARPNAGVIYRLYLGNFSSEKKADELVKHLKSKEGISALRLVLRN